MVWRASREKAGTNQLKKKNIFSLLFPCMNQEEKDRMFSYYYWVTSKWFGN